MKPTYRTKSGRAYCTSIEDFIESSQYNSLIGSVDLILTSPPYPLVAPKEYGNLTGETYVKWMVQVFTDLKVLLSPRGSIVVEIGNAWNRGTPTMSTIPIETLLSLKNDVGLHVCQQFIWNNPNKLPGPAPWVTLKRVRVKDSFTNIWWYSPSPNPKANNRRVLTPYTKAMENLLERQSYNRGMRPSGHNIGDGFLRHNQGAIPASVLSCTNSRDSREYREWCKAQGVTRHPARMPEKVAEFFINLTTTRNSLVFDPFAGSNTTGKVAESLERRWISVERDPDYVLGSKGRFVG
jgi:site-specific DNA-methyltransferase (cytosine-N4-specific)